MSNGEAMSCEEPPVYPEDAACGGADVNRFYPEKENAKGDMIADEGRQVLSVAARKVVQEFCGSCVVRGECLAEAIERNEPAGIWGGKNSAQRRRIIARFGAEGAKTIALRG